MYQGYSEKGPQHLNKKPQNCQMGLCKIKSLYSKKSNQQTKETCLQNEGEMFINIHQRTNIQSA